ncbi:gamma-glutamylcyclotransferase [Rhodocyclus tenuis]|uniref:gamma-glutamylcyclotransferase n=1 Tax=Rhodocyclus tenuis TaxID=1066 RepID=UPI00190337DA|nr:gamma-glutamylcyclotransferase [Rhodocyclus tenuis]
MNPRTTARRLHFFYGAHLDPRQFASCSQQPRLLGSARLANCTLAFFGYAMKWDGAEESLQPSAGAETWGVLYELAPDDAERLDAEQCVRLDGSGAYFHIPVEVVTADGSVHEALTYLRSTHGEAQLPSREFLANIVAGARAHGLPADYLERLQALPSKPASYRVPRENTLRQFFSIESACNC